MKKFFLLLIFSLIVIACNKKEVKKETIKEEPSIVIDSIKETVEEIIEVPEIIFTIQIAALKYKNTEFVNLQNIQFFEEDNLTKYRLGTFSSYKEAHVFRTSILNKYPDAFVQALKNGKPINIKEALKL
ncbi:SPOR domain-containing protein [Polaribacter sp. L3A8]|uniref:SPOR domain-containing protein n=1 Tax=Polaribacter sp. L3A8 TaxID=2686361 RepID=UPI00131E9690|nr:SPOR domain-containing protein [Polaribacter sp. L3A8]